MPEPIGPRQYDEKLAAALVGRSGRGLPTYLGIVTDELGPALVTTPPRPPRPGP